MSGWPMTPPTLAADVEEDFELPALPEDFKVPVYPAPAEAPAS